MKVTRCGLIEPRYFEVLNRRNRGIGHLGFEKCKDKPMLLLVQSNARKRKTHMKLYLEALIFQDLLQNSARYSTGAMMSI